MKALFIGGTGNISTSVSTLAIEKGVELYLLNRGQRKSEIPGATQLTGDIKKPDDVAGLIDGHHFDCVVNWIGFTVDDMERDIELFAGKTNQYVFISSASVYQKPLSHPIVTESTPLANPHWAYSRRKIACEDRLMREYRDNGFPITIVRPSLTYGDRLIPLVINSWGKPYTVVDRMKQGKPVIVPGDGTSLWTITHSDDFAKGFVGLMGNQQTVGHSFHITSDEVLTWNQIYEEVARAVGVEPELVHLPSELIMAFSPHEEGSLVGDKAVSVIMDNSKIKRFVPDFTATVSWAEGVRRSIAWFEADRSRIQIDDGANALWDRMIQVYNSALEQARQ